MRPCNRVLYCNTPYGQGGIGQHFAQLIEDSRESGCLEQYIAPSILPGDDRGVVLPNEKYGLFRFTPLRLLPSWKSHVGNALYDLRASRHLPVPTGPGYRFMGFVGKALFGLRRARSLGYDRLELVAANSHVDQVVRQHKMAASVTGVTDTWLNVAQIRRTRLEYDLADVIYVHSEYVRQSFLDAGIDESRLHRMVMRVRDAFRPPAVREDDGCFRIVYVGRLDATKGVPILLDAFDRLPIQNKSLHLVGGGMPPQLRRHLEPRIQADARITAGPGNPVPVLHRADVFVQPTFEDGFAYAPAEALACGVPVIVTEDTGMKEYVEHGRNGFIVPTGSVDAIVDRLLDCHRGLPAQTHSLFPLHAALDPVVD